MRQRRRSKRREAALGRNAYQQPGHHFLCVQGQQASEVLNEKYKGLAENNSPRLTNHKPFISLCSASQPGLLSHYPLSSADWEELEVISSTP